MSGIVHSVARVSLFFNIVGCFFVFRKYVYIPSSGFALIFDTAVVAASVLPKMSATAVTVFVDAISILDCADRTLVFVVVILETPTVVFVVSVCIRLLALEFFFSTASILDSALVVFPTAICTRDVAVDWAVAFVVILDTPAN